MGLELVTETFQLLLTGDNLLVFEDNKSDLVIDAIIRGIHADDPFPTVFVTPVQRGVWSLTGGPEMPEVRSGFYDGGHYRALGHYIEGVPLHCIIDPYPELHHSRMFPLKEIKIITDTGQYDQHKKIFPRYR